MGRLSPPVVAVAPPAAAPPLQLAFAKPDVRLGAAALTWRGISRLFLNDAAAAVDSFAAAEKVADGTFIADILWYRAVAEQRAGNNAAARARLESLCHGSSSPERACAALEQLNAAVSGGR